MPGESLMKISHEVPWYADLVNYLVANIIPEEYTYQQKKKFFMMLSTITGMSLISSSSVQTE